MATQFVRDQLVSKTLDIGFQGVSLSTDPRGTVLLMFSRGFTLS